MPSTNAICSTSDDYFFSCITKTHLSVLITLVFMIYNVAINVKICVLMYAFSFASTCALMSFMDWDCDLSLWNVGIVHTERERKVGSFFLLLWSNKSFVPSHKNASVGRFDTQPAVRWTALSWFTEISRCDCIYPVEGSMTWNLQHFIKSILILVYIFLPIMPHGFVWEVRGPVDSRVEVIPHRGIPCVHITIYFYRYPGRDHCLQSMFKDNSTHNDEAP